jgi:hypothetical protein
MAEPYSADLRERVLLAYEAGLLPAAVARGFGVGLSRCISGATRHARRAVVVPSRTPAVARWGSTRRARRSCGRWWRSGTIVRLRNAPRVWRNAPGGRGSAGRRHAALCGGSGFGAKRPRASEQDRADIQQERAVFRERIRQIDPKDLVFVDETGIAAAMTRLLTRLYARRAASGHGARSRAATGGGLPSRGRFPARGGWRQ